MSKTGNHMIDEDDGSHPASPKYREPEEKPEKERESFISKIDVVDDEDIEHLYDATNEALMEELMSRYNPRGYVSLIDSMKIEFLFRNIDSINLEKLEALK